MRWIVVLCLVAGLIPALGQPPKPPASYDAMIARARTLIAEKKPQQAVAASEQAIALNQNRWEAYVTAASGYSAQQLYDNTISMLQMALGRAPDEKKQAIRAAIAEARRQLAAQSNPNPVVSPPSSAQAAPVAPTQAEIVLWKSIESSNRAEDYRGYLASYPNGVYAGLANSRIEALMWNGIESTQNQDDLRTYLQTYPNGPHALAAARLLENLRWAAIEKSTNPADFRAFILEFPNSPDAALASNRIEELDWLPVSQSTDPADFKAYIDAHPNGQYLTVAQKRYTELIDQQNDRKKQQDEASAAEAEKMRNGWDFKWSHFRLNAALDWVWDSGTMSVSPEGFRWEEDKPGSSRNFTATCADIKYTPPGGNAFIDIYVKGKKMSFSTDDGMAQFLEAYSHFCQHH